MRAFLSRRVYQPLLTQLKRGASPEGLALSLALGATLGLFPIMGLTSVLCLAAGAMLRLNHATLQLANYLVYPLQVSLILFFVRLGERLVGAPPLPLSVTRLAEAFGQDPLGFLARFGLTGLHGVLGWLTLAPLVGIGLYFAIRPLLRAAASVGPFRRRKAACGSTPCSNET